MTHATDPIKCTCGHTAFEHNSRLDSYQTPDHALLVQYYCKSCTCARYTPTVQVINQRSTNVCIDSEDFLKIVKLLKQAYNTISLNFSKLDTFGSTKWMDETWDILGKYKE